MTTDNNSGLAMAPNLPTTEVLDRIDRIAKIAAQSGLTTYRKTESASMILLTGRELGLGPMASLRGIHDVSGKPVLAADLMVAVVRRSGLCQKWRVVKSTVECCEIVTRRVGEEEDESCVWTADDAKRAGCGGSTWQKFPRQMLSHRCAAELARRVYSDVLLGLYTPDELDGPSDVTDDRPEPRGAVIDAEVVTLPRDNGPSPSGAPLPAAEAPIVEAPPVALPLSDRDHRAMLAELTSATDLGALRAAWKGMADDEKRGTEEQRAALLDAATKRKAVFAEEARLREERKAAADAEPPNDDGPPKPPRGPRKARTPVAPADATGGGAEGADGPVDAPGARSSNGAPMTTRAERRAHLATLPLAETVRLSWRHRAAMPPPHYREDCALRVCALTHGFGVDDALAYLDAAPLRVVAPQPKTRAA